MELQDRPDNALDYQAEIRPDGVIDIPGDPPAPRGPGLSKGTALILAGLLMASAGWAYEGLIGLALITVGGGLALVVLLLMLGLPRLRKRPQGRVQSTGISTSLRRSGPGMKGEL